MPKKIQHIDLTQHLFQFHPHTALARVKSPACEFMSPGDCLSLKLSSINCPHCLKSESYLKYKFFYDEYETRFGEFKTELGYKKEIAIHRVDVGILSDVPLRPIPWEILDDSISIIKKNCHIPLKFFIYFKDQRCLLTAEILNFLFDTSRILADQTLKKFFNIEIPVFLPGKEPSNFISPTRILNAITGEMKFGFSVLSEDRERLSISQLRPINAPLSWESEYGDVNRRFARIVLPS